MITTLQSVPANTKGYVYRYVYLCRRRSCLNDEIPIKYDISEKKHRNYYLKVGVLDER